MLAAVVAGYEVGGRVGESVIPESYFFWHTTGTAGTLGAAASAAKVLGLDAAATLQCLGSAGTQAAGLWEFLKEGAMSKTLHAGKKFICRRTFSISGPCWFYWCDKDIGRRKKAFAGLWSQSRIWKN